MAVGDGLSRVDAMSITVTSKITEPSSTPKAESSSDWINSDLMSTQLGNHVVTLRNLRRIKNGPFKEGRDYRFTGVGRGRLRWHRTNAEASLTAWQRPAEPETFSRAKDAVVR